MTKPAGHIETEALSLVREARIRLAIRLLDSIEERPLEDPAKFDRAWIEEANRRYEAYVRGDDIAVPAEQVFAELRSDDR
jgi:putative addiction module component (TIGR02574 family)